jgi:glycosyltransferase involved in cell wall biosynthesis
MAVSRPTILQIIPELDTGGAELSTVEIAEAVVKAGGRAIVLSEGGRLAPKLTDVGAEFVPFPAATKNPLHIIWNAGRIAQIVRRENVDLVHARSRAPAWSALLAARQTKRAFVTTYHGAYKETGRIKRWYNSVMARGDVVIANSSYTADLVRARYGTPEARIRVIYRGVDGDRFDPAAVAPERIARLREAWGVTPAQKVILNAGRLTRWKGQSVVIDAAHLLKQRDRLGDAVFILAGDSQGRNDYAEQLAEAISAVGLQCRIRMVGHVDDMPAAFSTADIAIVASIEPEAFGRAAAEAQIMGCPVISTDIGAPPETVLATPRVPASDRTGWLVPPGDAASLADSLDEALALDDDARQALGERARRHVLSSFTLDAMKQQTLEVYDRTLGTGLAAGYASSRPPASAKS